MRTTTFRFLTGAVTALALLAATARVARAATPNGAGNEPAIVWGSCPEAWTGPATTALGERLQCGSMAAPLDHEAPDGNLIEIGVIRMRAAHPGEREGSIFIHRGGPGSHPGRLLQSIAESWMSFPTTDVKGRLAARFDLVAVIPRGLVGSTPLHCLSGMPRPFNFLPGDLGDENWHAMIQEAQAVADACRAPPHARYINTEQHVHDMDMLRRALGDDRIHFFGISHGGLVGAWYASIYPEHVGRMVLDSSFDFTRDYAAAVQSALVARHQAFLRNAAAPLLRSLTRYGLGTDAAAVSAAIHDLPPRIRALRPGVIDTPEELAATLHLAALWHAHQPATAAAMARLLQRRPMSADPVLDARMRHMADQLTTMMYAQPRTEPTFLMGADGDSVRMVVPCNDVSWNRSEAVIRQQARDDARRYLSVSGHETFDEIVCTRWHGPSARTLSLPHMERIPPFLLLQSEQDSSTPLAGTLRILDRFTNARMLLVRGTNQHGLFNFTRSPCIERTTARYLLTGVLPQTGSRVFACDGTQGSPADAMPGEPEPQATEPVEVSAPVPPRHDEL